MFADVIVDVSIDKSDRSFQYKIPKELGDQIKIGSSVFVPFGRGAKPRKGFVVGLSEQPKIEPEKIKEIASVPLKDVAIESRLIELAGWMRERYGGSMNVALKTVLPVKRSVRARRAKSIYDDIAVKPGKVTLNGGQQACVDAFSSDVKAAVAGRYLLFGVTGSGKTEVYFGMIDEILARGRSVIVLIPEISLTYQTLSRFYSRYGGIVSVMHSRLSAGERYEQYERARKGDIRIMIGPRSALFTPFSDLGLIVIDEEHDGAYKSESVPRYHAVEVAERRAEVAGASLVLGSATPSLASYSKAVNGKYRLLNLRERATPRPLPECRVIDLREELMRGNRSPLSRELQEKMSAALSKGQQIILFLNRRGFSGFVSCRACSHVIKCPHCDISLSLHRGGRLKCHYCGFEKPAPKVCPSCGSKYIGAFKAGTQQIETLVKNTFPGARVLRMDADTTARKGAHEEILRAFGERKADILIGTQMIVKGHDFPGVSLVGILAADMSLFSSDYYGPERTFQLIVQAAGRAGRGSEAGEVLIQAYDPDHYAITTAAQQDYESFYEREMAYRSLMSYPPVAHMMRIQLQSKDQAVAMAVGNEILQKIRMIAPHAIAIGPSEGMIPRAKDTYRVAVYVRHADEKVLIQIKDRLENVPVKNGTISFDLDPIHSF